MFKKIRRYLRTGKSKFNLWLVFPHKYLHFYKEFKGKSFTILDVGCGNHVVNEAKVYLPGCIYHGIDNGVYNNSEADFELMDKFYDIDLTNLDLLQQVPDSYYDVIILNHVIEHLKNGLDVIAAITKKLKQGGIIFIEYPSLNSVSLPSMLGTLNFCDDSSHVKLYEAKEICNILIENKCRIIKAKKRRMWRNIIFLPYLILKKKLARQTIYGGTLWDIAGFAEYVFAKKI